MPKYVDIQPIVTKIRRELMPNIDIDGTVSVEDAERYFLKLLESAPSIDIENISDGFHTFEELYHHRAVLFSIVCNMFPDKAWKSKYHYEGDMFEDMFIVGIDTPEGQATYHYYIRPYWDLFKVKELDKAPPWDKHTSQEAINRLLKLMHRSEKQATRGLHVGNRYYCSNCGHLVHCINYCENCGAKMIGAETDA